MRIRQRDLVLLPFPFSNLEERKVRPALVVSNNAFNAKSPDCVMVPITSVLKEEDYSIPITQSDLASGELIRPSRVRAERLFFTEKRIIIKSIGALKEEPFKRIRGRYLGCFSPVILTFPLYPIAF